LISTIKEWEKVLSFDNISYLGPLFLGGVNSSRVMSTSMQNNYSSFRGIFKILNKAIKIKSFLLSIPISVLPYVSKSSIFEDKTMVTPGWVRMIGTS